MCSSDLMPKPIWAWFPSNKGPAWGAIPCMAIAPTVFPSIGDAIDAMHATATQDWRVTDDDALVCASRVELERAEKWFKEQPNE